MSIDPANAPYDLPTPDQYQRFLDRTELRNARLIESEARANAVFQDPSVIVYDIDVQTKCVPYEEGFEAVQDCTVSFSRVEEEDGEESGSVGKVRVQYGFFYEAALQDIAEEDLDAYFYIFERVSLPVNAWPFIRQFVHDMTQRMNWPPLMLPLLKETDEPGEVAQT